MIAPEVRAAYQPKTRTSDPARPATAHVPEGTGFSIRPALAPAMIERAMAAAVPFAFVAADTVYDVGQALRRAGKGYVLGVTTDHAFKARIGKSRIGKSRIGKSRIGKPEVAGTAETAETNADGLTASAWTCPSAGEGTKGARPGHDRHAPSQRTSQMGK